MPETLNNAIYSPAPSCAFDCGPKAVDCFAGSNMFTFGTLIAVPGGVRPIDRIAQGDLVETLDNGAQAVRHIRCELMRCHGADAPISFEVDSIGNTRAITVSPDHRILITGWRAELLLGCDEVLVTAKDLVNGRGVRVTTGGLITYVHLEFDQTQIVFAEGSAFECCPSSSNPDNRTARMVARYPETTCLLAA